MNFGFTPGLSHEVIRDVGIGLNYRKDHRGEPSLWGDEYASFSAATWDRIMLFDLTNFYFEGRKDASRKAKFGRSKEKRGDCKLLVLALCINT